MAFPFSQIGLEFAPTESNLPPDLDEQARLPQPDRDRPLHEVIQDFGRCLRPDGPYGPINEWSIYDESLRRLVSWAREQGRWFPNLSPLKEGGREHDITHVRESDCWLKFTKPSRAGYVVSFDSGMPALEPGLPLDYFERLLLQNEVFADEITFVGIAGEDWNPRIVTRQPDIPGEGATDSEIRDMMTSGLGFIQLPDHLALGYADSMAFFRDDVAVFDLRTANVVRTGDGTIVPIDVISVSLDEISRAILREHSR